MNADQDQLSIPLSKSKLALLTLGSVAFVAAGVWLWSIADSQTHRSPEFTRFVSVACIAFFGLCGVYGLVKLFDSKPGLIISKRGISDNSSAANVGLIEWKDIDGFDVTQIQLTKFLVILVHDPSLYLQKMHPLKRMMMNLNRKMVGSPITISSNSLACDFSELRGILEAHYIKYNVAVPHAAQSTRRLLSELLFRQPAQDA